MSLLDKLFVRGEPQEPKALERRIARLAPHERSDWANNCIYAVGRSLSEYDKDPTRREMLDEAVMSAEALVQILKQMRDGRGH